MKHNYRDILIRNFSVIIGSALAGLGAREIMLEKGADQFTANCIFWIIILIGVVFYMALISLGLSLLDLYKKLKTKKIPNKLDNQSVTDKGEINIENNLTANSAKNLEISIENIADTNVIRKIQHQKKLHQDKEKLQLALDYTKHQFALYTTDDDLKLLCDYVTMYAEKSDFENIKQIKVKDLSSLDLYHFGWNIWNYFKPIKQEEVSKLLKMSFYTLKNIELDSIKSHLKDDPEKGIIKIVEDISGF